MSDSLPVWDAMRQLGALGLQTVIDDFGTGFSNVSYLLKLAVNRIKIDQTFIASIEQDPGCNAVVSSLISMARSLGVSVIAEGVETEGQRAILLEKGCEEAQGYLFYRPISFADLRNVLIEEAQNQSSILVSTNCQSNEARECEWKPERPRAGDPTTSPSPTSISSRPVSSSPSANSAARAKVSQSPSARAGKAYGTHDDAAFVQYVWLASVTHRF